jgi:hypothetical protein
MHSLNEADLGNNSRFFSTLDIVFFSQLIKSGSKTFAVSAPEEEKSEA